jgi:hypothetical protein
MLDSVRWKHPCRRTRRMEFQIVVLQVRMAQVALSEKPSSALMLSLSGPGSTYLRVYINYHIIASVGHGQYWRWVVSLGKWMLKRVCEALARLAGLLPVRCAKHPNWVSLMVCHVKLISPASSRSQVISLDVAMGQQMGLYFYMRDPARLHLP